MIKKDHLKILSSHGEKSQNRLVVQSLCNVTLAFTLWGSGYCCNEYNFFISSIAALQKRRNASGDIVFLLAFIIRVSSEIVHSFAGGRYTPMYIFGVFIYTV
jgi:hypothetical protein